MIAVLYLFIFNFFQPQHKCSFMFFLWTNNSVQFISGENSSELL